MSRRNRRKDRQPAGHANTPADSTPQQSSAEQTTEINILKSELGKATQRISEIGRQLAEVSTAAWRLNNTLPRGTDGEISDRRMARSAEALQASLKSLGVDIIDRTGLQLGVGHYTDVIVVANESSASVSQETIIEVIKPAVRWRHGFTFLTPQELLVQKSDVVTQSPT